MGEEILCGENFTMKDFPLEKRIFHGDGASFLGII